MPNNKPNQNILLEQLLKCLDDNQATRVVTIDVRGQTTVTDYMIVASGRSSRQVKAMASIIVEQLKKLGFPPFAVNGVESEDSGEWVLIDFGDCVLHIMQPDSRAYYDIEGLWQDRGEENKI
jgi:ribosome-associated protein